MKWKKNTLKSVKTHQRFLLITAKVSLELMQIQKKKSVKKKNRECL